MKRIFVVDWILLAVFILTAFTGLELHAAGHGGSHELWHNWAVFHIIASILFVIATLFHVQTHWGWYKGWVKHGLGKKSRVTVIVSVLFVILSATGLILVGIEGANSFIGLWHYKIGIVSSLLFLGHIIKRARILKRSLQKGL